MKESGLHEGCIEQIQRLYAQRLYSGNAIDTDEQGRIRIDDWEMREDIQEKVIALWQDANTENLEEIADLEGYRKELRKEINLFI